MNTTTINKLQLQCWEKNSVEKPDFGRFLLLASGNWLVYHSLKKMLDFYYLYGLTKYENKITSQMLFCDTEFICWIL